MVTTEKQPEPRSLTLANDNNKLLCNGFIQIHFAPEEGSIREGDFNRVYQVKVADEMIEVKLVDFTRLLFEQIGTILTIPATGLTAEAWKVQWLKKYPATVWYTKMAVYCYERVTHRNIL